MNPHAHKALAALDGSRWSGTGELWLDPLGDQASTSPCTFALDGPVLRYTWSHEGAAHRGSITLEEGGALFTDTFHQPDPTRGALLPRAPGIFQLRYAYGPDADWGWRIALSLRAPTGELVLQMTNIAPWGEEVRAVRMVCQRET
jgi:hypothetical protein